MDARLNPVVHRLRVDTWAADAVTALRARGINAVLLKGPVIARWLYADDPSERRYQDVDLLVSPADQAATREVLVELGYELQGGIMPELDEPHARVFERHTDGAEVDLHRVLHGMEGVPTERVWRTVMMHTETLRVGNVEVATPDEPLRALHLVLHTSFRDGPGTRAWADLQRGLEMIELATWEQAVALARSLGVTSELGHRLALVPEAAELV
ncbi:MAG TPA: nucleotidyltransferase family protein, partial [Solirubrobacteraceae bacterium]|nr:nucleotidyltransferase family protein [Solirubrobacteraceae bacterium]